MKRRVWHLYADRDGYSRTQPACTGPFWKAVRDMPRRYSGDGNWLELLDPDGNPAIVLVRYTVNQPERTRT